MALAVGGGFGASGSVSARAALSASIAARRGAEAVACGAGMRGRFIDSAPCKSRVRSFSPKDEPLSASRLARQRRLSEVESLLSRAWYAVLRGNFAHPSHRAASPASSSCLHGCPVHDQPAFAGQRKFGGTVSHAGVLCAWGGESSLSNLPAATRGPGGGRSRAVRPRTVRASTLHGCCITQTSGRQAETYDLPQCQLATPGL